MIREAIQAIQELTKRAQQPFVTKVDGIDDEVLVNFSSGPPANPIDSFEWKKIPATRRKPQIHSLESLFGILEDSKIAKSPELYYAANGVAVLLERETRRDIAHMPFAYDPRYQTLVAHSGDGILYKMDALVRFLRTKLAESGEDVVKLLGIVREIEFETIARTTANLQHAKETLGRSVEAAANPRSTIQIPDVIAVDVPVYTTAGIEDIRVTIRVGVLVYPQDEAIRLQVIAGQMERAQHDVLDQIGERLRARFESQAPKMPIFHGVP